MNKYTASEKISFYIEKSKTTNVNLWDTYFNTDKIPEKLIETIKNNVINDIEIKHKHQLNYIYNKIINYIELEKEELIE